MNAAAKAHEMAVLVSDLQRYREHTARDAVSIYQYISILSTGMYTH